MGLLEQEVKGKGKQNERSSSVGLRNVLTVCYHLVVCSDREP